MIKVFIVSPTDVNSQRDEVENTINDWNNQHTDNLNVVLLPVRWERSATSSYRNDESGQAVINKELVLSSDLLIALFGNRIGTRTSSGKAGTVEEINTFHENKEFGCGIFFVDSQIVPHDQIKERYSVDQYKEHLSINNKGLYQDYSVRNIQIFLTKNVHHLLNKENKKLDIDKCLEHDLFNIFEFDKDEQLFIIFSIDEEISSFGDRWQSEESITKIRNWEEKNGLNGYLSSRYSKTLEKLGRKNILIATDYTSHGNPKMFTYNDDVYRDFKETVLQNCAKVLEVKGLFKNDEIKEYFDTELPF